MLQFRDFCSKTRPRNVCRSAKQRPRNQAILLFLHKIRQNAPSSALKCAAMSSKSHQMLVGMILQHPWNILGRVKNFAIFAPKIAPEMRGSPVSAVLGSSPGKGTPFAGKTKNRKKSILIFFLCNVDRRIWNFGWFRGSTSILGKICTWEIFFKIDSKKTKYDPVYLPHRAITRATI